MKIEGKDASIIGFVYETYDYSLFKKNKTNRTVQQNRKDNLVKSISKQYVLNPIVINDKWEVIEGQGRFEAVKELGLPVRFVVDENAGDDTCLLLNRYNTSWGTADYLCHYKAKGSQSYERMEDLILKTKMSPTVIMTILKGGGGGNSKMLNKYKDGEMTISEEQYDLVIETHSAVEELMAALDIKKAPSVFYRTVAVLIKFDGYSHRHMLSALKKNRTAYEFQRTLDGNLKLLEEIYNRGYKDKIYFSDYTKNKGYNIRDYHGNFSQQYANRYMQSDTSTLKKEND